MVSFDFVLGCVLQCVSEKNGLISTQRLLWIREGLHRFYVVGSITAAAATATIHSLTANFCAHCFKNKSIQRGQLLQKSATLIELMTLKSA